MQNTEPPITHGPAGRGTAQQPDTDRRALRRAGLRGTSLGICVMLIAQLILGVGVNLYVHVPAADQGHGPGTSWRSRPRLPAWLPSAAPRSAARHSSATAALGPPWQWRSLPV